MSVLNLKSTIFLCLALVCFSCSKDVDGIESDFESKIVLNSVFMPGEIMTVDLSTSRNIFDSNSTIQAINSASVEVTDLTSGTTHSLVAIGDGKYESETFRPDYGRQYTINVSADGFESVEATSEVPYPAFIKEPEAYQGDFDEEGELRELFVNLEFYSESSEPQYYVWEIVNEDSNGSLDFNYTDVLDNPVLLFSDDSNTESVLADESFQTRVFLSNDGMSEGPIQTSFVTMTEPATAFQFGDEVDPDADVLINVRVMTVSKDLYDYYKSMEVYRLRGTINSSITQPVDIHSNVENGLGIFAGFTAKELPIRLN